MNNVIMYSTSYCPYCVRARQLLERKQIPFTDILIDDAPEKRAEMIEKSKRHTVPQIFIKGKSIGGCDDLHALEEKGLLDELLQE